MTEQKGIEGLKSEVDLGFSIFQGLKNAKADGHIGLEDLGLILPLIPKFQAAYAARLSLGEELKDLSSDELSQLAALIVADLGGVADEALQNKIVKVVAALKANYDAIKAFA